MLSFTGSMDVRKVTAAVHQGLELGCVDGYVVISRPDSMGLCSVRDRVLAQCSLTMPGGGAPGALWLTCREGVHCGGIQDDCYPLWPLPGVPFCLGVPHSNDAVWANGWGSCDGGGHPPGAHVVRIAARVGIDLGGVSLSTSGCRGSVLAASAVDCRARVEAVPLCVPVSLPGVLKQSPLDVGALGPSYSHWLPLCKLTHWAGCEPASHAVMAAHGQEGADACGRKEGDGDHSVRALMCCCAFRTLAPSAWWCASGDGEDGSGLYQVFGQLPVRFPCTGLEVAPSVLRHLEMTQEAVVGGPEIADCLDVGELYWYSNSAWVTWNLWTS